MSNLPALKQDIAKMGGEFGKALPGHITADKFVRTTQTAIALTRNIDKVRNPQSLLAACSKAASDGLILDGREAALVIDNNGDVQYRPMMRGLLKLAYNSGALKSLVVEAVRDNDLFDYQPTRSAEPIIHKIDLKTARGEVYAVYALAMFKDGGIVHEVMTVEDVNRIRDRSDAWRAHKAGKIKSTPWATDWSEMARKTVFRRLSKYLPASSDRDDRLAQAAERIDEDYTFAIDAEPANGNTQAQAQPAAKKRGGAAAALKDVTPKQEPAKGKAQAKPQPANDQDDEPYDRETGEILDYDGPDQRAGDDI
ncbi:recombinase RecT [Mesorhizobium abyssinicae]|uniref:Recombinase RecT n=1 Tax=Mesorhizobium abyssinicae TaxID=1209958 RepID=A0ABU5AIJ3_9HYPH|nr:recombinase RecT [Mesorhizobium abyssinicae]MDX8537083.1 recombinase RecT [Mesorhizobium abyssinicae]